MKYRTTYTKKMFVVNLKLTYNRMSCVLFFFFFVFLGPHPWHMEGPRLGVESEL